jgi:hypothetical protein
MRREQQRCYACNGAQCDADKLKNQRTGRQSELRTAVILVPTRSFEPLNGKIYLYEDRLPHATKNQSTPGTEIRSTLRLLCI